MFDSEKKKFYDTIINLKFQCDSDIKNYKLFYYYNYCF